MRAKLSELGAVITGNTPSKQEPKYWASSDIPFIKPDVINQYGITEVQTANDYISEIARSKARIAEKNVVLVTCIGTIGKICITGKECAFNQQINAIIPNDKVLPEYLAYCIYYNRPKLIELANAPVVPIINKRQFEDFSVNIEESIERQGSTVTILKEVDRLICYRQKQLQKLDDLVKARFVELFGDGNHPHIALIDLIIEGAGLSYGIVQPGDDGTGDMGVLRPVDMVDGKISTASIKYIDRSIGDGFKKTELYGDELLITVRGTTGITALTDIRFNGMNVTRGIAVVRYDRNKINPVYLNAYLNTDESQRYIQEHTRGATLQQINLSDLRVQQIMVPPLALQEQMAAFIEQIDKSKAVIQKALDEAQLLFDSLMQQYFG